jgi:hypothetical protein
MTGISIRRKARQIGTLVGRSVLTPRSGETHRPKLVTKEQLGVTFIGHSSFFLQIGGKNILIDPNFARWIFVLSDCDVPGCVCAIFRPSTQCWLLMLISITCTGRHCGPLRT